MAIFSRFFFAFLSFWWLSVGGIAESPAESPPPTPAPTPVPTVSIAEIVPRLEEAGAELRVIEEGLTASQSIDLIERDLPALSREIEARQEETLQITAGTPSLKALPEMEANWEKLGATVTGWKLELVRRVGELSGVSDKLDAMALLWKPILADSKKSGVPDEIQANIQSLLKGAEALKKSLTKRQKRILTLQTRVAEEDARVSEVIAAVKQSRNKALDRLFKQDGPPLWNPEAWNTATENLLGGSRKAIASQWVALRAYSERQLTGFIVHALLLVSLYVAIRWLRPRILPTLEGRKMIDGAQLLLDMPACTAAIIALMASGWIYADQPPLFHALVGAAILIPAICLLRHLITPRLFPVLAVLIVFYLLDEVRALAASQPVLSRLMFTGEVAAAIALLLWLIRSGRLKEVAGEHDSIGKTIRIFAYLALGTLGVSFVANALGYAGLGTLLGDGLLSSSYRAVILYGLLSVIEGIVMIALSLPPLSRLAMVRHHRTLLWQRTRFTLRWIALVAWFILTLKSLSLRGFLGEKFGALLATQMTIGSVSVSIGDLAACALTIWGAFLLSRFLRFLLEEEVYERLHLPRGIPFAISKVLHYAILVIGFTLAISALGVSTTKFTILAGAFGVGLGFGMQNIVNNFVSGLILLFERPVKVGDVIQVDNTEGTVTHIGIRASVIRMESGSEAILPNGKLISDRLTNWTLSNQQRGFEIPISLAKGADPATVLAVMAKVAAAHPKVSSEPKPLPLFVKMGATFDFELRVWTFHYQEWMEIRSELTTAIQAEIAKEEIAT